MYEEEELEVESKSIDEDTLAEWVKKGKELCSYSRYDEAEELLNRAAAAGYEPARVAIEEMKNKKDAEERFFACSEIKDGVLVRYGGDDSTVIIPAAVTGIGNSAFEYNKSLQNVIIGNNVTHIEASEIYDSGAFGNCYSLNSITIPKSLTSIGENAFYDCINIENITYLGDITSWCKIKGIGNIFVFYDALIIDGHEINELSIPNNIDEICEGAFYGCESITNVVIPDSVVKIGKYAFCNCWSLKSINISSSVTDIDSSAFSSCRSLESITVERGNPKYRSVGNCLIETDSKSLILGCKNSIIPTDDRVVHIAAGAFKNCSSLTDITIPRNVTNIGNETFFGCNSLKKITIKGDPLIGSDAFYNCNLKEIIYGGNRKRWKKATDKRVWGTASKYPCVVHCSDGDIKIKA